jgi:hypothetical protein
MDIKPLTGLVNMQYQALLRKCVEWYERYAQEQNLPAGVVSDTIETFCHVSARMIPNGKKDHALLALVTDDETTIRNKFEAYLDLELTVTNEWVKRINALDKPTDGVLAPVPDLAEAPEKNG